MLFWWKWAGIICTSIAIAGCKSHFICQGQFDPVGEEEPYVKSIDAEINTYPDVLRAVFKDVPIGTISIDDRMFNYVIIRIRNNSIWFSTSADDTEKNEIGLFNRVTGTLNIDTLLGDYEMDCDKVDRML